MEPKLSYQFIHDFLKAGTRSTPTPDQHPMTGPVPKEATMTIPSSVATSQVLEPEAQA